MAVFGALQLTTLGQNLYTKAQTGTQINFTRMQIGSGQLTQGQDPTTLSALINPISYFNINSITSNGATASVKGIYENTNQQNSAYACELGLFATDPTAGEILYAYANAGTQGDTIPPISGGPISTQYNVSLSLGIASNVTATIPAGTYLPQSELGQPNGVASLDASGFVPVSELGNADGRYLQTSGSNAMSGSLTTQNIVIPATGTATSTVSNGSYKLYLNRSYWDGSKANTGQAYLVYDPSGKIYVYAEGQNAAFEIDTNYKISTLNNVLDDGNGNMTLLGTLAATLRSSDINNALGYKIQYGQVNIGSMPNANTQYNQPVSFPTAFTSVPKVYVVPENMNHTQGGYINVQTGGSETTTGFKAYATAWTPFDFCYCNWIAIGM